ncbi:MAG: hypothetical protein LBG91_01945 [Treponema sp.]|nr:hypothetical protein [Treponema sp.]
MFAACNDPVFYAISKEVKPIEPFIKGGPSNFAVSGSVLFVASGGGLYRYSGSGWEKAQIANVKKIASLASDGTYLYALTYAGVNTSTAVVKRLDTGGAWTNIDTGGWNILNIYAAGGKLFIGVESSGSYTILYVDGTGAVELECTGEICGAAFNGTDYFLCTKGDTVYRLPGSGFPGTPDSIVEDKAKFYGIISLENDPLSSTVAVITRDGKLYTVTDSVITDSGAALSGFASGALAVWRENGSGVPKLLLAGRQDSLEYTISSGYTYGYVEIDITSTGTSGTFREPGGSPSSISPPGVAGDTERYKSTIGKNPVNHLFQAPVNVDGNMTLFASTQKNGVWSYRERKGLYQWNAEEKD